MNTNDLFAGSSDIEHINSELIAPAAVDDKLMKLAQQQPANRYFGAASWSYPGWHPQVWGKAGYGAAELSRYGLHAYAKHPLLGCAELDSSWYKPPTTAEYQALCGGLPDDFYILAKVYREITATRTTEGEPNPLFLNSEYFDEHCLSPFLDGLGNNAGPLLLCFSVGDTQGLNTEETLSALEQFLSNLPAEKLQQSRLTIEIRQPALLNSDYASLLAEHNVAHSFSHHPSMPGIADQARALAGYHQPRLVVRWLLQHGFTHESARQRFTPFPHIQAPDLATRKTVALLARKAAETGRESWIIAGNKAEGCAPETLFKIAEECPLNTPKSG